MPLKNKVVLARAIFLTAVSDHVGNARERNLDFTDNRLLPTYASITFEHSQHRTKRQDVATAIKGRGVQARSAASIKEQGIGAIQPVTE
jgi:hypothetical protein